MVQYEMNAVSFGGVDLAGLALDELGGMRLKSNTPELPNDCLTSKR